MAKRMKKKNKEREGEKQTDRKAKFHGVVGYSGPQDGVPVKSGEKVAVSIRSLSFGKLPELGKNSELQFDLKLSTTKADGKQESASLNSGVFYYIKDNSTLNIDDWLVFDQQIHQQLTIQFEITEAEFPRKKQDEWAELVKAAVGTAGKLPVFSDPASAVLETVPSLVGAIIKLNADDQVLKYHTSLYTEEVKGKKRLLKTGTHVFEKRKKGDPKTVYVRLGLDVRKY